MRLVFLSHSVILITVMKVVFKSNCLNLLLKKKENAEDSDVEESRKHSA